MKRLALLFLGIIASFIISAQNTDNFNYQAVIRDANGSPKANTNVTIAIDIVQGTVSGIVVFNETHTTTTNAFGLVNLKIGSLNPADFSTINWANSPFFLKISVDGIEMGTNQLISVPYALHAKKAETYTETDPIYTASQSYSITPAHFANWNTAFSWGNHATAGYLTSVNETDPIFLAHPANGVTSNRIADWDNAFAWGDHGSAGYLKSFTETDPIFLAHPANGVTSNRITDWDNAFAWGDHGSAGYLKSFTETDPTWSAVSANYYTKTNLQTSGASQLHFNNITSKPTTISGYGITDAMTTAHDANGITSTNISDWNTAYGWGNHSGLYRLISYVPAWSEITSNPFNFSSPVNNQLLKYNSISSNWENWTPDFLTTEVDGSITNELQTLDLNTNQLTISSTSGNTVTFTNWDTDKTDDVTVVTPPSTGDMLYYNGINWSKIPVGTNGQVLTLNASGIPEWQTSITIPTASTQAATFSLPTTIFNGIVNPNKLPTTVTFEYGTTTGYGTTVTASQSPVNGGSNTSVSYNLSGLIAGTSYHYRVKAVNAIGTTYGDDMTFTFLGIGINYAGGLIFYIDASGQHGLVAAASDQNTNISWDNGTYSLTGASGTAIATGQSNTTAIVNVQGIGSYAAQICDDLNLNGYTDWFLPSRDELTLMYTKLKLNGYGGFTSVNYWSSSESNSDNAYIIYFGNGASGLDTKDIPHYVRAARAF